MHSHTQIFSINWYFCFASAQSLCSGQGRGSTAAPSLGPKGSPRRQRRRLVSLKPVAHPIRHMTQPVLYWKEMLSKSTGQRFLFFFVIFVILAPRKGCSYWSSAKEGSCEQFWKENESFQVPWQHLDFLTKATRSRRPAYSSHVICSSPLQDSGPCSSSWRIRRNTLRPHVGKVNELSGDLQALRTASDGHASSNRPPGAGGLESLLRQLCACGCWLPTLPLETEPKGLWTQGLVLNAGTWNVVEWSSALREPNSQQPGQHRPPASRKHRRSDKQICDLGSHGPWKMRQPNTRVHTLLHLRFLPQRV